MFNLFNRKKPEPQPSEMKPDFTPVEEKKPVFTPQPIDAHWTLTATTEAPVALPEQEEIAAEPEAIAVNESPVQIFSGEFGSVRVVMQDNEPWFVAADVCKALEIGNTSQALSRLDSDEKGIISNDTPGGKQEMTTVSEPGLYSLVLSSRKPEAKAFKRWITHDVIPSIRKHGAYMTATTIESIIADPASFVKLAQALADEKQKTNALTVQNAKLLTANTQLEWEVDGLSQKIEQDAPKTRFADSFKLAEGSITVNELAKLLTDRGYETGEHRLYETLRKEGYLIKDGKNRNLPTQRSMNFRPPIFTIKAGSYTGNDGKEYVTRTTYVTPAGQIYFFKHFCGDSFRTSEPMTAERLEEMKAAIESSKLERLARGRSVTQKRIDRCAAIVRELLEKHSGELMFITVPDCKNAIPELAELKNNIEVGKALKQAGAERKITWNNGGTVTSYGLPAALFEKEPVADASEPLPNFAPMSKLEELIKTIISDAKQKNVPFRLMAVEPFRAAHPELVYQSNVRITTALHRLNVTATNLDGVPVYKLPA